MTERTAWLFMMSMMQSVFSDQAWFVWEPLIEEVRPKGKTPPKNLGRTISAIFWRHQNGAKWRAIPSEFGPWWIAAQLFIRWSKLEGSKKPSVFDAFYVIPFLRFWLREWRYETAWFL